MGTRSSRTAIALIGYKEAITVRTLSRLVSDELIAVTGGQKIRHYSLLERGAKLLRKMNPVRYNYDKRVKDARYTKEAIEREGLRSLSLVYAKLCGGIMLYYMF